MKPSVHKYDNAVIYQPKGTYSLFTQFQPLDYKKFTHAELAQHILGTDDPEYLDMVVLTDNYVAIMDVNKQDDSDPDANVGATSQMAWYGLQGVLHGPIIFCHKSYVDGLGLRDVTDSYIRTFTPKMRFA